MTDTGSGIMNASNPAVSTKPAPPPPTMAVAAKSPTAGTVSNVSGPAPDRPTEIAASDVLARQASCSTEAKMWTAVKENSRITILYWFPNSCHSSSSEHTETLVCPRCGKSHVCFVQVVVYAHAGACGNLRIADF